MKAEAIDDTLAQSRKKELAMIIANESKATADEFNTLERDLITSLSKFGTQGVSKGCDYDEPGDWFGSLYFYVSLYSPQLLQVDCLKFVRDWIRSQKRKCVVEFVFESFPRRMFEPGMFFMQLVITDTSCWVASHGNSARKTKSILKKLDSAEILKP